MKMISPSLSYDVNQNVVDSAENVSNRSTLVAGDIVWLKHDQSLATPMIIHQTLDDDWVEVRNLLDCKLISLQSIHLTTIEQTLISSGKNCRTWFKQYSCRKSIHSLIKAVKKSARVTFCAENWPKILNDALTQNCKSVQKITSELDFNMEFEKCMWKLYGIISKSAVKQTKDELQSIAKKIWHDNIENPLKTPKYERVCHSCLKTGRIIQCSGPCQKYYHKKCISIEPSTIDWKKFEEMDDSKTHRTVKNCTGVTVLLRICYECKNTSPVQLNGTCDSNNNDRVCGTCEKPISKKEKTFFCVRCPEQIHSDAVCIPAGALLLSETQFICAKHSEVKLKTLKVCSGCNKSARSMQRCPKCACSFHKKCYSKHTECSKPTINDTVYVFSENKLWPAIIVRKHRVPQQLPQENESRQYGPGYEFVYVLGKSDYDQIHVSNMFNFKITDTTQSSIFNEYWHDDLKTAVDIAEAIANKDD